MSGKEILRAHYIGLLKRVATWSGLVALAMTMLVPMSASAQQITARKVTLSSSSNAASNATTTYTFNFTVPQATTIKSWGAAACTTALGTCTTPTGFTSASSTFGSQTNLSQAGGSWTINTSTAGELRILNAGVTTGPTGAQTVVINNVQNPTSAVGTFYMRITTYSDAAWGTPVDTGTVAASTATQMVVNADVAESLTFCVGTVWTTDCTDISGTSKQLSPNPLTTASISTGTSELGAATNGTSGFVITYIAGQFTCAAPCSHNFNNAFTSGGAASAPGTEEFGLKVAQISGTGGVATAPYNGTNYAWNPAQATGTQVASSGGAAAGLNRFTVTYGANVAPTTNYGSYSTTLNYVCTPTF